MMNKIKTRYPFNLFLFSVYLLQLENYHAARYFKRVWERFDYKEKLRGEIVWTHKMVGVAGLAALLLFVLTTLFTSVVAGLFFPLNLWPLLTWIVFFFLFAPVFPFLLVIAVYGVYPLDHFLKSRRTKAGEERLRMYQGRLTVIGVTGSYGKTTMKEVIGSVLAAGKNVLVSEENKNTPLGVAKTIQDKLDRDTEVFVVEMGAFKRGDIRELAEMVKPDIGVITGINEAHLERQGSIENIIETKFELAEALRPGALLVLNGADKRVRENASRFTEGKNVFWYGDSSREQAELFVIEDRGIDEKNGKRKLKISRGEESADVSVSFIAPYVLGVVEAALRVGEELGLGFEEMMRGLGRIKASAHRLEVIRWDDTLSVIDDSYNGNPDGVRGALKLLKELSGKRRVYVTPGLVEMGERSDEIHEEIGRLLAKRAEVVVLIKNSTTAAIRRGLKEGGFDEKNIYEFNSSAEAHSELSKILKTGDVVLFQNDWPQNYL